MAEQKKIIAVVGATGAQGGGAGARHPGRQGRRLRGPRHHPQRRRATRRRRSRALGAEVVAGGSRRPGERRARVRRRVRRVLRHQLLGALLAREGDGPGAQPWRRRPRRPALQHVIWSTLEDTRKWVPLDDDRMPTLHGQVQGAALRRQGRSRRGSSASSACRRRSCSRRSTGTTSSTSAWARSAGRTASSPSRCRWTTSGCPGIAAEDIGKCAYGIFKRGKEFIGKTVGIAGEHLTGAQMAAAADAGARQGGRATTTCRPRCTAASASPAPTTSATCSSSSATSTTTSAARATSRFARTLNPELQTFDQWLGRHKDQIPIP